MRVTRIKVCGVTRAEDARAAADAGVHAVGVVFYGPSPRAVSIACAEQIAAVLPPFVTLVGLFVDPDTALVERVLRQVPLGLLQFHGEESCGFCAQFNRPYIKALRMRPDVDLQQEAMAYRGAAGILLDSWVPGIPGGTGQVFDWRSVPDGLKHPIILAGGLDAGNVGEAMRTVLPAAVDVSGGVEIAPGEKDARMIAGFVQAVRRADEQLNQGVDE